MYRRTNNNQDAEPAATKRVEYTQEELERFRNSPPEGQFHDDAPAAAKTQSSSSGTAQAAEDKASEEAATSSESPTIANLTKRLNAMRNELMKVLPSQIPVDRFIRITITAVSLNNDLLTADVNSLLESTMKAAQDGLLCDGREAALVTFMCNEEYKPDPTKSYVKTRKVKKVKYMPMVKGLLKIIYATGAVSSINVHEVYEQDVFDYQLGDDEKIIHQPARGSNRGDIVAAYCIVRLLNGGIQREVIEKEDLQQIRNMSKANTGPWQNWAGEMSRKSVIRRAAKYLPSTPELDRVLEHDNETYDLNATPNGDALAASNSKEELERKLTHQPAVGVPAAAVRKDKVPV